MPASPAKIVFTHGDIRPVNILVRQDEGGSWTVVSIIDWESSGFYPKYWECVKMTNNLTPRDGDDWYLLLPESLSPRQFPVQWLIDRIWDAIWRTARWGSLLLHVFNLQENEDHFLTISLRRTNLC
ncbi:uncharacterized protein B0T15DRAFT_191610 [Chaetomium strumarium]|uniref:Aminoglycoside phosphotransferase domain-containing protein n=1 Tax=Chaetomium strumarium TaxID=1170767 RepID=A0AAJ0GSC6_9PEZI|nr:hypothetical protein B0T15DRAFT_191610 [Chaetomium strumarium]